MGLFFNRKFVLSKLCTFQNKRFYFEIVILDIEIDGIFASSYTTAFAPLYAVSFLSGAESTAPMNESVPLSLAVSMNLQYKDSRHRSVHTECDFFTLLKNLKEYFKQPIHIDTF